MKSWFARRQPFSSLPNARLSRAISPQETPPAEPHMSTVLERMTRISLFTIAAIVLAPQGTATADARVDNVFVAYTLVAPVAQVPSGLLARAVVPAGGTCPVLRVKKGSGGSTAWFKVPMSERRPPDTTYPAFSAVRVCEAAIPRHSLAARVLGRDIPAHMPSRIKRLAVLGDTGCRVGQQDCSNPDRWPLARTAERIAEGKPHVVLFLGDFFYREKPCPADQWQWCGSTPEPIEGPAPDFFKFSDTDYSWLADVFIPMRPLLAAAPLVVVRGNHEACSRGGNGYFLFFDPRRDTANVCAPSVTGGPVPVNSITPSWSADLKIRPDWRLRLAIVDSASPEKRGDYDVVSYGINWAEAYRPFFAQAAGFTAPQADVESWLLTHRPVFGIAHETAPDLCLGAASCTLWTSVPNQSAAYGLLDNYSLILSSHIHLAQSTQIPGQPPQLVLGNGGTHLETEVDYSLPLAGGPLTGVKDLPAWVTQPYPTATSSWTDVRFGYAMLHPGKRRGEWRWQHMTPEGRVFAQCEQAGRSLDCASRVAHPEP